MRRCGLADSPHTVDTPHAFLRARRYMYLLVAVVALTTTAVDAIPVGKIAGRITDENGIALEQVTVLLDNTTLWGTTDSDGNYVVLQVPPGTYNVVARRAGFRHIRKPNVAVYADRTVRIDFSLPLAGIEIETETVSTRPPLITPDITTTRSFIDLRQYRRIPSSTIIDVLAFESGVRRTDQNDLAIRGFRPGEVVYQIDGFTWMNPLEDRPYTEVNVAFIEQVQIVSGAYVAAKPGRGAIINIVTRDPANMPTMTGDARYTPPHRKHFGPSAYSADQYDHLLYLNDGTSTGGRLSNDSSIPSGAAMSNRDTVNSYYPVYRVQQRADVFDPQPVFVGWKQIANEVNAGTRALGDSLIDTHRGSWTPEALKQVWSHRHRAWSYADQGDLLLDLALASPSYIFPRTNIAAGYRHNRTVHPVPAVVQAYTDRAASASFSTRFIPRVTIDGFGRFEIIETTANGALPLDNPRFGTGSIERYVGIGDLTPLSVDAYDPSVPGLTNSLANTLENHGGASGLNKYNLWANVPYRETVWGGGVRMQHRITNRAFYGLSAEHLRGSVEMKPAERRGSNDNPHRTDENFATVSLGDNNVAFLDESPWGFAPGSYSGLDVVGGYYLAGGGYVSDYSEWMISRARGSLFNQITANHGITIGGDLAMNELHRDTRSADRATGEGAWFNEYTAKPLQIGVYLQDNIEYDELIADVGVRIDGFDANWPVYFPDDEFPEAYARGGMQSISEQQGIPANIAALGIVPPSSAVELLRYIDAPLSTDPGWLYSERVLDVLPSAKSQTHWRVSPRIGVSHPAGERMRVFFNYGRMHSAPAAGYRYGLLAANQRTGNRESEIVGVGNPNLKPPRTTIYEVGVDYHVVTNLVTRLRGYSGSETNEPTTYMKVGGIQPAMAGGASMPEYRFTAVSNDGYRLFRGIEAAIEKPLGSFLTGSVNVDLREVTVGRTGVIVAYEDPSRRDVLADPADVCTDFQPTAQALLMLSTPTRWGSVLGGWELSATQIYRRGPTVTYYRSSDALSEAPGSQNSQSIVFRWIDTWRTNARASKTVRVGDGSITVYGDVRNVFDVETFNLAAVDRAVYFEEILMEGGDVPLHRIGDMSYTLNGENVEDIIKRRLVRENDWLLFLYPRSFQFGIRVNL